MLRSFARLCILSLAAIIYFLMAVSASADVASEFRNPPPQYRPWSFWFWINGNISKEGITADLEAMQRVGIGGVLIMEVANPRSMAPEGPVKFASPQWKELFAHMIKESTRLGMQVDMNNDAGWCGSGGPWITPELSMKKLVTTSTTVSGSAKVDIVLSASETIANFYRDIAVYAVPARKGKARNQPIRIKSIVNVTDRMTSEGRLTWDAPDGNWEILRIGYTSTGVTNKPAPESGKGLECDKFDADAITLHFNSFIKKLADDNREAVGKVFVNTHIDSWEVGPQTWTEKMPAEFRQRRGYDVTPWLITIATRRQLGSPDQTIRFQRDFTRTCAELNEQAYAGALRKLANREGIKLSIEAYGQSGFLNPLDYAAEADMPVSEFWIGRWDAWHLLSQRLLSSVAHLYNKPVVGAESFTSMPNNDPFTEHPYSVKTTGDWAFCEGVNKFIFHRTVHDPWTHLVPGMSFAGYGWHVDRNQTWFEQGAAYMNYVARCQSILQRGQFVADVCRLLPDGEQRGSTRGMQSIEGMYEPVPAGYNYDYISDKSLIEEMRVEKGRLVSRAGMSYTALQLPRYTTMTVELARKVAELVEAGAMIVGPKPDRASGLTNFPAADAQVREIADKAWDTSAPQHVISDVSIRNALAEKSIRPDFTFGIDPSVTSGSIQSITSSGIEAPRGRKLPQIPTAGLNWIHRRLDGADFYFVANPQHRDVSAICAFNVSDMQPEIWDPVRGEIRTPAIFAREQNLQLVPMKFGPAESVFVVFRKKIDPARQIMRVEQASDIIFPEKVYPATIPSVWNDGTTITIERGRPGLYTFTFADGRKAKAEIPESAKPLSVAGPWKLEFQEKRGAPKEAEFAQLVDWSKHENAGIKYFSGTATYRTSFDIDATTSQPGTRYLIDLGEVQVMAQVILNGTDLGVLWKKPFSVDITTAIHAGKNELEIKVTNLWPNRLIGDEQFPDDCTPDGSWKLGTLPSWPDWVKNNTPRPEPRRVTFTTWKYYTKDSPLLPSGLIGPVTVTAEKALPLQN